MLQSPLFDAIRTYFEGHDSHDGTIFVFAPYIRTKVLARLLDGLGSSVIVVTTWELADILSGSSDLDLYPFCQRCGMSLYVSEKLHLKVYSANLDSAILATGNVSRSGLLPGGNHEAGAMLERLDNADRLYLETIRLGARLVDGAMHARLVEWKNNNAKPPRPVPMNDVVPPPADVFLTSSLPMTRSVGDLVSGYLRMSSGGDPSDDMETAACIFHDLANYGMGTGLSEAEFRRELQSRFFAHPFIQRIGGLIGQEAYFGRIKAWIQANCTDVPVPSRRELTGNVQVLLEWFVALGRYEVDIPGARSQRIRRM